MFVVGVPILCPSAVVFFVGCAVTTKRDGW